MYCLREKVGFFLDNNILQTLIDNLGKLYEFYEHNGFPDIDIILQAFRILYKVFAEKTILRIVENITIYVPEFTNRFKFYKYISISLKLTTKLNPSVKAKPKCTEIIVVESKIAPNRWCVSLN